MPRSLVLGNGNMLVNIDNNGIVRDFYYPYVGLEEHTRGHHHHVGVFEEETGEFSWFHHDDWQAYPDYLEETLVTNTILKSEKLGLEITFNDFVTVRNNIFCRNITVKNLREEERNLRFFFQYDFHMYGNKSNDTVYFEPGSNSLVYYNLNRYFLVNASKKNGIIDQFTTGKIHYQGLEGTWKDAEDGKLESHPITQGSVDATFGIHLHFEPKAEEKIHTWVCIGKNADEVHALNLKVKKQGIEKMMKDTKNFWQKWVNKLDYNFDDMPEKYVKLFKRSLLTIRTQIDNNGAITAANDTDIRQFNKDDYSYMWPRDGALVAYALDNVAYTEVTDPFYKFCARVLSKDGFLMHKYNSDGSVGSSWHPYIYQDCPQAPLQEDETALPIRSMWNHYQHTPNIELLHKLYNKFVIPAADFMVKYRDPETNLPRPSYDLWEEQKGIFTWTISSVYAGLRDAAKICDALGSFNHSDKYQKAADEVKEAAIKYLFDEGTQRFVKKITYSNHDIIKDTTVDASISGIFLFNMLDPNDPKVVSTMEQFPKHLEVPTDVGGFARYPGDHYQRTKDYPENIPGNPWIITTLWYAQWCLRAAKGCDDPKYGKGIEYIEWATNQATKSQILPEQLDPFTGKHLSVSPLTWSHATYIESINLLHQRLQDFGVCKNYFIPPIVHT